METETIQKNVASPKSQTSRGNFFDFIIISCLLATNIFLFTGCGKESDPNNPDSKVSDPEGTITISVRNSNNGSTSIPIQLVTNQTYFGIDGGDNFWGVDWYFVNIGKVNGLGNVTKIPENGWSSKCAVMRGYGYVGVGVGIKWTYANYVTFARIYVDDYITAAGTDGVIGAMVKYQYPFNGTATKIGLSANSTKVGQPITLNNVSCSFSPFNAYNATGFFSFDGTKPSLTFYVAGTYTVSSPGLPDEKIVVSP